MVIFQMPSETSTGIKKESEGLGLFVWLVKLALPPCFVHRAKKCVIQKHGLLFNGSHGLLFCRHKTVKGTVAGCVATVFTNRHSLKFPPGSDTLILGTVITGVIIL